MTEYDLHVTLKRHGGRDGITPFWGCRIEETGRPTVLATFGGMDRQNGVERDPRSILTDVLNRDFTPGAGCWSHREIEGEER